MESLSCNDCKGLCCGPVPVTKQELKDIKNKIRWMPLEYRLGLQNQHRYFGTCIFYDLDKDKCGIYLVRPSICRAFGHYHNLICFLNPGAASVKDWVAVENPAGILSADFTWKDFI